MLFRPTVLWSDTQTGDFPPSTGTTGNVPQDDQRDDTQRCRQHEDKGGIPLHGSRIHAVEDCNRRVGRQTLHKRQKSEKRACWKRTKHTQERRLACWLTNRTTERVLKGFRFAPSKRNFKSTCLLSTLGPKRQTALGWTWWTVQTQKAKNSGATHPAQPLRWSLTSWSAALGKAWSPAALAASLSSRAQT